MYKKNNINSAKLLNVSEAADSLGVNAGTIRRWAHNKQLDGIKVGIRGDWRFSQKDLSKMIQLSSLNLKQEQHTNTQGIPSAVEEEQAPKQMLVPRLDWADTSNAEHFVQFYENDSYLLDSLSRFIGIGLHEGDACIVVATKEHHASLEKRLELYGLDIIAAKVHGQFIVLDAEEALSKFMADGLPNHTRFFELVSGIMAKAVTGGHRVRIFGEMVALLWEEGNQIAAIQLEKLWNDLAKKHAFSLYCAYPMTGFNKAVHGEHFSDIGISHSSVIPAESYTGLPTSDEQLRAITLLQQKALSLQAEIIERKKMEKQKDDLLSMVSHELKTPLTSMKMFVELLNNHVDKLESETPKHYIAKIRDQVNRLSGLTNDLLDVSKAETGKLRLNKETFVLSEIIKDAIEALQATTVKHTIIYRGDKKAKVFGDKHRIYQILINLLSNAIKYSAGSKKIIVSTLKNKEEVRVSVEDFGIGINKDQQEKIFEKLYQVTGPEEKTFPGLGLGLYISKDIVERHKGKMWVESIKGKGSTFYFNLPLE